MKKQLFVVILACAVSFLALGCDKEKEVQKVVVDPGVFVDQPSTEPVVSEAPVASEEPGPSAEPSETIAPTDPVGTSEEPSGESEQKDPEDVTMIPEGKKREPVEVKGIYVTGNKAGTNGFYDLVTLVDETELNAMVIDIKNEDGYVTYAMDSPMVNEMSSQKRLIGDLPGVLNTCKEHDIYTIARIVTFCDNHAAETHPEWAVLNKDGSVYHDNRKLAWLNPYKKDCWEYISEIACQAAQAGFDEIQFDYIRLNTDKKMKDLDYGPDAADVTSQEIITEFVSYIMEELEPYGVYVAADVYGTIIGSEVDRKNVGQNYVDMCSKLDYICPMIYPSHYAGGNFGIEIPDTDPYKCIKGAMDLSTKETSVLEGTHCAVARPWLQAFTATWVKGHIDYGIEEVKLQIQAVHDAGYNEYLLWNSGNVYEKGVFE